MRLWIAVILAFFATSAVAAEWHTEMIRDNESAERVQSATITDEGYRIDIWRNKDNRVRWRIALPESSFDRLAASGDFIFYRIDNEESSSFKVSDSAVTESDTSHGTYGRAVLWHGQGPSPTRGTLRKMLDGKQLFVRFVLDNGSKIDRVFTLNGAPAVIGEVLKINVVVDPVQQGLEKERDEAIISATTTCMANKKELKRCLRVVSACMKDTETLTAKYLHNCMAFEGFPFE